MIRQETIVELKKILGERNVCQDKAVVSKYFGPDALPELVLASLEDEKQIQELVRFSAPRQIPIFTIGGKFCPDEIATRDGILLDTKKMNTVHEVDPLNLHSIIGAGVTFPELVQAVKRIDDTLKVAMPVAADSPYVLANYMRRNVTSLSPTLRGRTILVSNYHVVLPGEGDIFKSGSHSISEQDHLPDWPGTGGSAASVAFYGTDDALGIPFKGVIWVFPVQECRQKIAIGFPDVEKTKHFIQEHCRSGRMIEAYAANNPFLAVLLGKDEAEINKSRKNLPPWVVVGSMEGSAELVEVTKEILLKGAKKLGGEEIRSKLTEPICSTLERPWYVWDRDIYRGASRIVPYYTLFRRAAEFDKLFSKSVTDITDKKYPAEDIGQLLVPMKQSRSLYCEYDMYFSPDDEKKFDNVCQQSYLEIVKKGAFVDRPKGDIAKYVYSANPKMFELQRGIKKQMDPAGILNPDQLIAQEA